MTPGAAPRDDDPKRGRAVDVAGAPTRPRHPVPRLKIAYRWLRAAGPDHDDLDFHALAVDGYPLSGWLRVGLDAELAFAPGPYSAWYLTAGGSVGVQRPARLTPFIELRAVAGLIGGTVAGHDVLSYIYTLGAEAGVEVYTAGRFYLTAAIGWAHPTYNGVDATEARLHPRTAAEKLLSTDSLTLKIGVGL